RPVADAAALEPVVQEVLGMEVKGRPVRACRIEESADFASEAYFSMSVDPAAGGLRVMLSPRGGVDVEQTDRSGLRIRLGAPDVGSVRNVFAKLVGDLPSPQREALRDAGHRLAEAILPLDLTFLEINPVFVMADGGWVAGDAKMIADTNSIGRHDELTAIVE